MTASHCLERDNQMVVRLGTVSRNNFTKCLKHFVSFENITFQQELVREEPTKGQDYLVEVRIHKQ